MTPRFPVKSGWAFSTAVAATMASPARTPLGQGYSHVASRFIIFIYNIICMRRRSERWITWKKRRWPQRGRRRSNRGRPPPLKMAQPLLTGNARHFRVIKDLGPRYLPSHLRLGVLGDGVPGHGKIAFGDGEKCFRRAHHQPGRRAQRWVGLSKRFKPLASERVGGCWP